MAFDEVGQKALGKVSEELLGNGVAAKPSVLEKIFGKNYHKAKEPQAPDIVDIRQTPPPEKPSLKTRIQQTKQKVKQQFVRSSENTTSTPEQGKALHRNSTEGELPPMTDNEAEQFFKEEAERASNEGGTYLGSELPTAGVHTHNDANGAKVFRHEPFASNNPNISEIYSYSSLLQNGKPVTTPDGKPYVVGFNKDKKLELHHFSTIDASGKPVFEHELIVQGQPTKIRSYLHTLEDGTVVRLPNQQLYTVQGDQLVFRPFGKRQPFAQTEVDKSVATHLGQPLETTHGALRKVREELENKLPKQLSSGATPAGTPSIPVASVSEAELAFRPLKRSADSGLDSAAKRQKHEEVNRPEGSFPRNNAFHQKDKIPRSKAFYEDKTMPTDYRPGSPVTPPSPEVAEVPVKSVSQAGVEVKTTRPPESDDSSFLEQNPMRETLPGSSSGEVKPTPDEVKKASSGEQVSRTGLSSLLQTGKQLSLKPAESVVVKAVRPPREMTIIKGTDPQKRYEAALKAAAEEQRQAAESLNKRKM